MAVYADYEFYTDTYLGTAISSANFGKLALRASAVIDRITFNRIIAETDAIKMATCAVAEEIQNNEKNGNSGIQSESIGSNSVTYVKGAKATLTDDQKLEQAARLYLDSTGLMFKGFLSGE